MKSPESPLGVVGVGKFNQDGGLASGKATGDVVHSEPIVVLASMDLLSIDPDANPVVVADGEGV